MDGIELKGSVVLDEETLEKLKVKIREEVIKEIKTDGYDSNESVDIISSFNHISYYNILYLSIDKILDKTDIKNISFESDKKKYEKLRIIKKILDL